MTQKAFKIKKGDTVQVMVGRSKGRRGVVEKVFLNESRVLISGVNTVVRNMRPTAQNPNGRVTKTLPIHISNVALIDPSTDNPGKVYYKLESGEKTRCFKKTQTILPVSRGK